MATVPLPEINTTAREGLEKYRLFKAAVLERDGHKCQICYTDSKLTAHHIKPRDSGGSDDVRNGITLCLRCHDIVEIWPWERFWDLMQEAREARSRKMKDGRRLIWGRDRHGVFSIEIDKPRRS